MADPNLVDFYSNVAHFEKRRQKGYGFEAAGTLGKYYYTKRSRKRRSFLRPLLMVAVCLFGLKGMIYQAVGTAEYDSRVASLEAGVGFDRLGGWLMRADPVTKLVASGITQGVSYLNK